MLAECWGWAQWCEFCGAELVWGAWLGESVRVIYEDVAFGEMIKWRDFVAGSDGSDRDPEC